MMGVVTAANARATLEKWILATGMPLICDLERSQGAYLFDASRNIEYLDFFSFFASRPLGFNHKSLQNPEFASCSVAQTLQLRRLHS
jgi:L-lysine 6-transaminase